MKKILLYIYFLLALISGYSQSFLPSISIETGAIVSSGENAPFWFYSNQYGKISTKHNSIYLLPSIFRNFGDSSKIDYSYNISPILRYQGLGSSYLHQWYGEFKFHFIHFTMGAKEEFYGNQDSALSTGFILWSNNARPMPKITLSIPNYTPIPFTKKYLEFKVGMSHGWFDDNVYNKDVWLHHKYFYLRLGGKMPIHITYGLHHFAQWGGTNYDPYGKLPHNFEAFKNVFMGQSGNSKDTNTPWTEWYNALGNHIGSRNFGLEVDLNKTKVSLYWQNIIEDGSGKAYRNIEDGLFGISIRTNEKNTIISGFTYEFFNSMDQSGRVNFSDSIMPNGYYYEKGGNDNYFNNSVYLKGWSYKEFTIGTPLITSPIIKKGNEADYLRNNRIKAHHLGIDGNIGKIKYYFLYTYSLNYGTNNFPSPEIKNHSLLFSTNYSNPNLKNYVFILNIGEEVDNYYNNKMGFFFKVIKKI